jgi:hypothetical protein
MLPDGTVWLTGRRSRPRESAGVPPDSGRTVAAGAAPWALCRWSTESGEAGTMTFIAVPSRHQPLLVASRDSAVLRYLTDSLLSVPPGAKALPSFVLTVGLPLLRYRTAWILAALARAACVVVVRRTG